MTVTFPAESEQYRSARDRLLEQEAELRRVTESVAAARRALPAGGVAPQDYVFQAAGVDGEQEDVRLSELFAPGQDTLVIYNFMFPRALDEHLPCPSYTQILDSLDGAAEHFAQRMNLAVVAKASLPRIMDHAGIAAGVGSACSPRPPAPTTVTTSVRRTTDRRCRCSTSSSETTT